MTASILVNSFYSHRAAQPQLLSCCAGRSHTRRSAGARFSPQREAGSDLSIYHKSHPSHPSLSTFKVLLLKLASLPPAFPCQPCMMLSSTTFSTMQLFTLFSPPLLFYLSRLCTQFLPTFPFYLHPTAPTSPPALWPSPRTRHRWTQLQVKAAPWGPHPHGTLLHHSSATPAPHLGVPTHFPSPHTHHHCAPGAVPTGPHSPHRLTPHSSTPPSRLCPASPGAASLCALCDAPGTRTIYTWLEQIPRWLHSFPCILFSLPGPQGHFPFPPACPLPARLISLS